MKPKDQADAPAESLPPPQPGHELPADSNSLSIRPPQWDRQAFVLELNEARRTMPVSEPVMDELRRAARY
jgi:hypothetical protein